MCVCVLSLATDNKIPQWIFLLHTKISFFYKNPVFLSLANLLALGGRDGTNFLDPIFLTS